MSIDTGDQLQLTEFDEPGGENDEESEHGLAIDKDELIEELQAGYAALGYPPKVSDMKNFGEYSGTPYKRAFGSWTNALEAAGIPVPESRRQND